MAAHMAQARAMAGSTFSPLAHRAFATILTAATFANLGNAVQSVGASWQLTASGQPADVVALVQTAINLPMLLLALPAGALADMFERRRIILAAQGAMLAVALLLAGLALTGEPPAWAILLLTALLACGIATFSPALGARRWRSTSSLSTPRARSGRRLAGRSRRHSRAH